MSNEYIYVDKTEAGTSLNRIISDKNLMKTLSLKEVAYNKTLYDRIKSIDPKNYTSQCHIDFIHHSGVMEWNTRSIANQVDFLYTDKQGIDWAVELKATMLSLKDAIKNPNNITNSKKKARKKGYEYHLLICLPKDIHEQMEWMDRARIQWDDWDRFWKLRSIRKSILHIPNQIYAEPVSEWFLDEHTHQSRYYEKQELILDWIRSKQ